VNREDIIRMAKEADIDPVFRGHPDHPERDECGEIAFWSAVNHKTLSRFAALAAEWGAKQEREARAKVCEDMGEFYYAATSAIRKRGEVKP